METLIIKQNAITGLTWLEDCRGHRLSYFNTIAEAQQWCKDNGYRCRVQGS